MEAAQITSERLVTPAFVRMMALYNAEMNRRLFAAAGRLSDDDRRVQRGAFWGSIHGTLCHLLWGDQIWMSRFDGWPKPAVTQKESAALITDFDELLAGRVDADSRICTWAARVTDAWLLEDQVWYSRSAGKDLRRPRGVGHPPL